MSGLNPYENEIHFEQTNGFEQNENEIKKNSSSIYESALIFAKTNLLKIKSIFDFTKSNNYNEIPQTP